MSDNNQNKYDPNNQTITTIEDVRKYGNQPYLSPERKNVAENKPSLYDTNPTAQWADKEMYKLPVENDSYFSQHYADNTGLFNKNSNKASVDKLVEGYFSTNEQTKKWADEEIQRLVDEMNKGVKGARIIVGQIADGINKKQAELDKQYGGQASNVSPTTYTLDNTTPKDAASEYIKLTREIERRISMGEDFTRVGTLRNQLVINVINKWLQNKSDPSKAYEYIYYFTNRGEQPTPPIKEITQDEWNGMCIVARKYTPTEKDATVVGGQTTTDTAVDKKSFNYDY